MEDKRCKVCEEILPDSGSSFFVACKNCGTINHVGSKAGPLLSLMCATSALILYVPANLLPFMSLEVYGNKNTATIWEGIVTLSQGGSWGIAIVVFLASILIPFAKLIILFYLGLSAKSQGQQKLRTRLYNIVEVIGRWSMLDIFLLAVLVAVMKMGPWAHAEPGAGAWIFALVVIFTMISSAAFDPTTIWKNTYDKKS
ncbi:paraquat-inducible protein A [Bdellovibrio sp. HCB274]|uniref:paraquat-inducible protein A n=1 Tax=Bdellovibrio sp. HCB274 TaxID=3394361 RepID=UPI0039B61456